MPRGQRPFCPILKANWARPFAHPSPIWERGSCGVNAVFDDLAELASYPDARFAELRERYDRDDGLRMFQRPPTISRASRRDEGAVAPGLAGACQSGQNRLSIACS